jgi:filamentous hemagglutinin family protein
MSKTIQSRWGWQFLERFLGVGGAITLTGGLFAAFSGTSALAQIIPDNTLGAEGSVVTPNVNINGLPADRIEGGATRGVNLFHSFSEFNVGNGQRVYFANPVGIENILTRVTGSNLSNILGTLGVEGGASLFLLNPNGIIFGPNARLDIAGSFFASTADSIVFNNGYQFSAKNPQAPPLLTISIRPGLQYGSNLRGTITNAGNLAVGQKQILSLFGNTVTSSGSLTAPGGTIQVLGDRVALLDNAQIDVSSLGGGGTVLIGGDFQGKGSVPNAARTFVSSGVTINADALTRGNGGRVIVWADEVTGFYGNITARGGSQAGNGGFVEVSGKQNLIFRGNVNTNAVNGNLGSLLLDPTNLVIASGNGDSAGDGANTFQGNNSGIVGSILSAPLSAINDTAPTTIYESELEGLSGNTNVVLQATDNITVNNLADNVLNFAAGNGSIQFVADANRDGVGNFVMQNPANILKTNERNLSISGVNLTLGNIDTASNPSAGNARNGGMIALTASGNISTGILNSSSFPNLTGRAGNGGTITLTAGGNIFTKDIQSFATTHYGSYGNGGAITLTAGGKISTGNVESGGFRGGIITFSSSNGDIISGDITSRLVNTYGNYYSDNVGAAINVTANGNISTGNLISGTKNGTARDGGAINLTASGNISTGNLISTSESSFGSGAGGDITFTAGGNISTESIDSHSFAYLVRSSPGPAGEGGAITFKAGGNITTRGLNTSSQSYLDNRFANRRATSNGGAITLVASGNITTDSLLSASNSTFGSSGTYGDSGNGGAITLEASGNITTNRLDSSSQSTRGKAGDGGTISIRTNSDIFTSDIASPSSGGISAGTGGNIQAVSNTGRITTGNLTASGKTGRGNITLKAYNNITFGLNSNAPVIDASGSGIGGNITLTSQVGNLLLENSLISSNASLQGNGGDIRLEAESIDLKRTDITTTASGQGNAGNIAIQVWNSLSLDKSRIFTTLELAATGIGGNINIDAGSVSLSDYSFIDTATLSQGNAGNVLLKVKDSLSLNNSNIFSITTGQGNGGRVGVEVGGAVSLTNRSNISTAVNSTAIGNGGNVALAAHSLSLTGGSQVQALTRSVGNSGNVQVNATDSITISGIGSDGFLSGVFTASDTAKSGKGGDITLTSNGLVRLSNGGVLNTQTYSAFTGGDITVKANTVELVDGGQFLTNTFGSGQAGNITVNATDKVIISGTDPNFANRVSTPPLIRDAVPVTTPITLTKIEPNNSIAQAQSLDAFFAINSSNNFNPDVELSSSIPYVSISATGSNPATVDYYSFTVTAGTRGLFDIDYGDKPLLAFNQPDPQTIDTKISLFDSQRNLLASNDNALYSLGASGSIQLGNGFSNVNPNLSKDSYLRYVFSGSGTYFIQVATNSGQQGIQAPGTYTLQTSLYTPNVDGRVVNSLPTSGLFARTEGAGAAGNVTINTPQFTVEKGGQVSATATAIASTTQSGGSISVNASQVNLSGTGGLFAETEGVSPAGLLTLKPYNNDQSLTVNLQDGAKISASTSGSAQGGNLLVTAPESVTLRGNGQLSVETSGAGRAGDLPIETGKLNIQDGATVSASSSSPYSSGSGGNITVNASDAVNLSGGGGLFSIATGNGSAGNLRITTNQLTIQDRAQASVSHTGSGSAGNLEVKARSIFMNNQGNLTARTVSGEGGNIRIQLEDTLLLRNNSNILTEALGSGNGGNITINARGFVLAVRSENSDVAATAIQGRGGNVFVTAQGVFGFNRSDGLVRTPESDISAASELGINGTREVIAPDYQPAVALPQPTVTPEVRQNCQPNSANRQAATAQFYNTGRGGLPPNPSETLNSNTVQVPWVTLDSDTENPVNSAVSTELKPGQLLEAQGWENLPNGQVRLTAHTTNVSLPPCVYGSNQQ